MSSDNIIKKLLMLPGYTFQDRQRTGTILRSKTGEAFTERYCYYIPIDMTRTYIKPRRILLEKLQLRL